MGALLLLLAGSLPRQASAAEAGQGVFHTTLDEHPVHCSPGSPITTGYTVLFGFDDKTFMVPMPPGDNKLTVNFGALGEFTSVGTLDCVFDEGGTFAATAVNAAGDFTWTEISGEYMDRKPGISEGDPFPFVGRARCATTRTDDFRALCDNFELSFNGLAKALAAGADGSFHDFAGDFTLRTAMNVPVPPSSAVGVQPPVDGPGGPVPDVLVTFRNGVLAPGQLRVGTLADAHGSVPSGVDFPVRGSTEIDHGTGPSPFFPGGDERFIELETDATLPAAPSIDVCLPLPAFTDPSTIRPARVLHGEGTGPAGRSFVDRTSRSDPTTGYACARVSSFSKFALVTTDVCGRGQSLSDGHLTVAGGLLGTRTVVVDGLTDCTQYPANLPQGLRALCVPDAGTTPGECAVSIRLGVNRGGCNRVASTADPNSPGIDVSSYVGNLVGGGGIVELTPTVGPLIAALADPVEATVGPVELVLPARHRITTYRLRQALRGIRPATTDRVETDKDGLTIQCLDPAAF